MEKLYSWCTSLFEKLESSDYVEYFQDYFVETSVCTNVFIVGFISALVIAAIYYFIICNKSFALAKRYFWAITVFVTFLTSLIISFSVVMGSDSGDPEESTGIFYSSYKTQERLVDFASGNDEVTIEINNAADNYRESLRSGEELLPMEIALVNAFYSILFYLLFSLLFKKHTTHGKAIPW
ncbi:MAG: hypothetical protein J6K43_10775 [Lachnospiraceae bacterium]|nr:hypothetical protein [Lachnospiraceae bacterium]